MTLDGFLTVLALVAAIYAVLPPVQRLQASLSWRAQALVAVPACMAILAFELLDLRPPACPQALGSICPWLTLGEAEPGVPRKFAFLIALAWLIAAVLIHRRSRPSLTSIPAFTELATTQIDEGHHGDALKLLEPHMTLLAKASRRQCRRQRLYDQLKDFGPVPENSYARFARRNLDQKVIGENWPMWAAAPVRVLARAVPSHARAEHAASDMLLLLGNAPPILDYIVERRPYFAICLLRQREFGGREVCERYLGQLMGRPGSALYQELATNDAAEGMIGYRLPARNRLLHFLFADANIASDLSAWKGVGDYVERLLDGTERPGYWTWLNDSADNFDREHLTDPTYMGMFFFSVMVTSAAKQGVADHMWVYYLAHIAERLERGYDSGGEAIDRSAEFPIRAARLLYELIQHVKSWVTLYEHLPDPSPHRAIPERERFPGTIPHASAHTLGSVLHALVTSQRIDGQVVEALHEVILRTVRTLHDDGGELAGMRRYVIEALLAGGHKHANRAYWERLAQLFDTADDMLQYEIDDYRQALAERLA
ncbi:MAG TPA: hypothetical protein VGE05_03200 [Novosphingobium sp.]